MGSRLDPYSLLSRMGDLEERGGSIGEDVLVRCHNTPGSGQKYTTMEEITSQTLHLRTRKRLARRPTLRLLKYWCAATILDNTPLFSWIPP